MKILLIPLDGRPCNTTLPAGLARVAGCAVTLPPAAMLGRYMVPADTEEICNFLERHAPEADAIILSADMCVHGGIEMSRGAQPGLEEARRRLDRLEEIVRAHGRKTTLFSMITRGTITATKEEELQLWEYTGALNALRGKRRTGSEEMRYKELLAAIPTQVLADYDFARKRNQEINMRIAGWAAQGLLARTLFLQDDAGEHGPHIAEQKALEALTDGRADFMPGADEACSMLVAGAVVTSHALKPSINIVTADRTAMDFFALYERNPFAESLASHMTPLSLQDNPDATVEFFLNPPLKPSTDLFLRPHPGAMRDYSAFSERLADAVQSGDSVVLADCAHCNGADIHLMKELDKTTLDRLAGFAAWNTASNTLGTALAHAAMIAVGKHTGKFNQEQSDRMTKTRLLEDWLFQSLAREELTAYCLQNKVDRFGFGDRWKEMDAMLDTRMKELSGQLLPALPPYTAAFPWRRLFETEVKWKKA